MRRPGGGESCGSLRDEPKHMVVFGWKVSAWNGTDSSVMVWISQVF